MMRIGQMAVLVATVVLVFNAGCSSKESKLVGKWVWISNGRISEFFADGILANEENGKIWARTWRFSDDKLIIESKKEIVLRYVEFPDDITMVFTAVQNGKVSVAHRLPDE
jgi:hypothetical protein